MKHFTYTNALKKGLFMLSILGCGIVSAQTTTTSTDIAKKTNAIRVIDNKGTIKYLQVENGITQITNTSTNKTTTTWQLGGDLTKDTYIDANGKKFALDGLALLADTAAASTDAKDKSKHDDTSPGSGYTLLVRDEATGEIKKKKVEGLVKSGHEKHTAAADSTTDLDITAAVTLPIFSNIWVYRNGAKLIAGEDYTVADKKVTIKPKTTAAHVTAGTNWSINNGDIFEIQYVR